LVTRKGDQKLENWEDDYTNFVDEKYGCRRGVL
jgi:hypothetical protein